MPEQKGLALIGRQFGQHAIDIARKLVVGCNTVGVLCDVGDDVTVFHHLMMPLAFLGQRAAPIPEDAKEPGIERRVGAKAREVVVHANERVLHRFFGIFARAEHLHRETQRSRVIALHQQGEACAIALLCVAENVPVE